MNNLGSNIRKEREKRGFSQEYVAQELGINQSSYGRIERDASGVTVDRLYKIAEVLDADITNLLDIGKKTFSIIKRIRVMVMWKQSTTTIKLWLKS
ncbi:MAG: helix-turn-helix transcriptional regulator [Prevotellaceae bacterium]|jgi:transcriptional regulator with XRE-family HTH domain|nr:helix-turn-helix transcriptional regulator [Prevotellaceae bacterium]